ncbi:HTH-type transcriptional regulator MhqR [bacterium BMS3Abin03]|nr:HTH-type transcriptional regulator MhqR [bacterium BMS3Abin03]HDZ58712.1 MarR family transcriptional regulator [Ignavibacteriales bacterium]
MVLILKKRLKQKKFDSAEQVALLNILVTANFLRMKIDNACSKFGITATQFNMLRILNGKYPEGYPRREIINRMIEPAPDVTRLIDRLIKQGLVERFTSADDRRLSVARITKKGIKVLEKTKPKINDLNSLISDNLTPGEIRKISDSLEKIYGPYI